MIHMIPFRLFRMVHGFVRGKGVEDTRFSIRILIKWLIPFVNFKLDYYHVPFLYTRTKPECFSYGILMSIINHYCCENENQIFVC